MVNLATPINQLPRAQPISNDPILVQEILKESLNVEQNIREHQKEIQHPNYINPYIQQKISNLHQNNFDYTSMIKSLILVSIMVFIVQLPSLKQYIMLYIPQDDLNLLFRCILAGTSYIGLNFIF